MNTRPPVTTEIPLRRPVTPVAGPVAAAPLPDRLLSLDALRGFDMFWIMGGEGIVESMAEKTQSPFWKGFQQQLTHPAWNGFHMYDLIFPMFLFMAGVSTPFSIGRQIEKGKSKRELLWRVVRRGFILVLLGLVANNGLVIKPFAEIRFGSVLGRIGIAYMLANIIFIYSKRTAWIAWFCGVTIGYWLLLKFTSAPGFPMGDLTQPGNFTSYFDRLFLPGRLYLGNHDPEGWLGCIPATGTALLGIITGNMLRTMDIPKAKKALYMACAGIVLLLLAQLWNLDFPINKNLWTSSFVLQVGGLSLLFLSLFYYVIDVLGYQKWSFFFRIIGMNSILIYISGHFINWEYSTEGFFKWLIQLAGSGWGPVVFALCYIAVKWCFLYFMYLKKVFLRV